MFGKNCAKVSGAINACQVSARQNGSFFSFRKRARSHTRRAPQLCGNAGRRLVGPNDFARKCSGWEPPGLACIPFIRLCQPQPFNVGQVVTTCALACVSCVGVLALHSNASNQGSAMPFRVQGLIVP